MEDSTLKNRMTTVVQASKESTATLMKLDEEASSRRLGCFMIDESYQLATNCSGTDRSLYLRSHCTILN